MSTKEMPRIAESVKFWEEQDRINKSIIPRILKNHDLIMDITKQVSSFSEAIAKAEAKIVAVDKSIQSRLSEFSSIIDTLNSRFDKLEKRASRVSTPSRLPIILSISAFICSLLAIVIILVK